VTIRIQPLPPEHRLNMTTAALAALEDWRLVVRAHRFVSDGGEPDDALRWPTVPPAELQHALSVLVWKEQAYEQEVMERRAAEEAVELWLAAFPQPFRAYTNGDVLLGHAKPEPTGGGSDPIMGATFDTGAIVIGGDIIGMLWATDED
jgi:hypothetical protein